MADPTDTTATEESTSPWDADVEAAFEDEDVRQAVSDFLGDKVQPYVTKIEQDGKPSRDASRLWEGFEERPVETSIQVVKELYGGDIGDRFAELLQEGNSPSQAASKVEEETDVDVTKETPADEGDEETKTKVAFDDLPPEVQNAVAAQEQKTQSEAYYSEVDRIKTEHADALPKDEEGETQFNVDLFHPFVVASNGDFDTAWEAYSKFQAQAKEEFGIKVPDTEKVEPPTTLNSETRDSGGKPPTEQKFGTLDDAIDSFFEDQKTPPPTVGGA